MHDGVKKLVLPRSKILQSLLTCISVLSALDSLFEKQPYLLDTDEANEAESFYA